MFGEPDGGHRPRFEAVLERVSWWADVLTIPCVGYAENLDEVAALALAGADFVALGETIWRNDLRAAIEAAARLPEPVQ